MTDRRNKIQTITVVSVVLLMLAATAGFGVFGSVTAQTGGTADNVFSESQDVSNELNISTGSVSLVGPNADGSGGVDGVSVRADGAVNVISSDAHDGDSTFAGVEISADRIKELNNIDGATDSQEFLKNIPAEADVASNNGAATPVIVVEYAPQSNFSQITSSADNSASGVNTANGADGNHDLILIADEDDLPTAGSVSSDDVVAVSVSNDAFGSGTIDETNADELTLLADGGDFGTVASEITGTSESDLQSENIDSTQFVAGSFGTAGDTVVQQVLFADNIGSTDFGTGAAGGGETIHSEKITLSEDGADDTFFASIDGADDAAQDDNNAVITVDDGNYDQLENGGGTLSLATAGLTVETNADTPAGTTDIANRFEVDFSGDSVSLADSASEAVVSTDVEITSDNITVDGLAVDDDSNQAVDINADAAELAEVIVLSDASNGDTAVDVEDAGASRSTTITNSAILEAGDPTAFDNDEETGLNFNSAGNSDRSATVSGSFFVGFEQQITGLENIDTPALVSNNRNAFFSDDRTQLAVVENASGAVQDVVTLFGPVTDADGQAAGGDVIAVAPGTYEDTNTDPVDIGTNDVVVDGTEGSDRPEIINDVDLDDSTNATLQELIVDDSGGIVKDAGSSDDTVTVQNVTLPADDSVISITTGDSVTIDTVEFTGSSSIDVVDITATNPDVTVSDVVISDLTGSTTGINIDDAGSVVSVTNSTVDGDSSGSPIGVKVNDISTASSGNSGLAATVDIDDNTLLDLSDGTGLDLDEDEGGSAGSLDIDGNEIRGGEEFIGVDYTLADTVGTNVTANTIIGADVDGEANSVGVRFDAVTVSGDGVISSGDATTLTFEDNVLSGHARVVESRDDEFVASDYDAIVGQALVDGEDLNNTIGTLVVGPDGTNSSGSTYQETYGSINDTANAVSYLPGSVEQAAKLANQFDNDVANADFTDTANVDVTALEVQDPIINGVTSPDSYDEGGDVVNFPDMESLTITGAGDAQAPLVENSQIVIDDDDTSTGEINNHSVSDLAITHDSGNPALDVTGGDNSQTTFANLNVISNDDGLDVSADGSDVNVIEVRDSTFDVDADGIVLAGAGDDRDGFVIDNVTLAGPGIATGGSTGLDLSDVDKPGKEELPVELEVREVNVRDFETQLQLSTQLVNNFPALDSEAVFENNASVASLDGGDVAFEDNEFLQAALVSAEVTLNDGSTEERLADATTIYGSIDLADSTGVDAVDAAPADLSAAADVDTIDTAIIDVRTGPADAFPDDRTFSTDEVVYSEDVSLGAADPNNDDNAANLLVRGPQAGADAGPSFRAGGEAVILGATDLSGGSANAYTDITLDGLTIVGDSGGDALAVDATPSTVNIDNTAVTADDAGNRANGVDITADTDVTLSGSFVGNHDNAVAVNNGVTVNSGGASLTVEADSLLDGGAATGVDVAAASDVDINGDVQNFDTGVDVTTVAPVTITGDITSNDAGGVNVTAGATLTADGADISDNGAAGLFVDSDSATVDVTQSTVESNGAAGIQLDDYDSESAVNRTTFSGNTDAGLVVNGAQSEADDLLVRGNAFTGETAITTDNSVDATLNFFGDERGPEAGASVSDTVVYDPFLSADKTGTAADVTETTDFAHDVVIPAGERVSVGFPATPDFSDLSDAFDLDAAGGLFEFNETTQQFELIEPSNLDDVDPSAFDAYVVDNVDSEDQVARISYADDPDPTTIVDNTFEFQEGLNFVSPAQAGTVDETLFPGGDTDSVLEPFGLGENLYGAEDATQSRDEFVDPDNGFGANFRSGVGDRVVHPHAGYIVIVNEESNNGLEVAQQIITPDGPTADVIANRTSTDLPAAPVTNLDTGEEFDTLTAALNAVEEFQTLELRSGTFVEDRDDLTISTDNIRLLGQGTGSDGTEIEADLTLAGDSIQVDNIDVVTASPTGDVTVTGAGVALNNIDADGTLDLQGPRATVTDSSASSVTVGAGADDTTLDDVDADQIDVSPDADGFSQTSDGGGLSVNSADFSDGDSGSDSATILGEFTSAIAQAASVVVDFSQLGNVGNVGNVGNIGLDSVDDNDLNVSIDGTTLDKASNFSSVGNSSSGLEIAFNNTVDADSGDALNITIEDLDTTGVDVDAGEIGVEFENGAGDTIVNDSTTNTNSSGN